MSLATCDRCGRAFEYKPSPHFREEFHYCNQADCEPTERYKRFEERMKEPTVISEAMLAHMAAMPKFRFQFGASGFRESQVDLGDPFLTKLFNPQDTERKVFVKILYTQRAMLERIVLKFDDLEKKVGEMQKHSITTTENNSALGAFDAVLEAADASLNSAILSAVKALEEKKEAVCV